MLHIGFRRKFCSSVIQMKLKTTGSERQNYFDLNEFIKTVKVTYRSGRELNEWVTVNAKYADIGNGPNVEGTVVTLSGSPGSHNDFKYMKEFFEQKHIRLVCTNWPGSEFVEGGLHDSFTNQERNSYLKSLMEVIGLREAKKLVIMGHSRGGENALQLTDTLTKCDPWPIVGTVMINSPGFVPHKGINERMRIINLIASLIKRHDKRINYSLFSLLNYFYNNHIGLRVANGEVAAASILTMQTFAFDKQKISIDNLKKSKKKIRVFYGYGSKDFLIDEHESEEVANYLTENQHLIIAESSERNDVLNQIKANFADGINNVAVNFKQEGHFLQKTQPEFIVDVIEAILKIEQKSL